ncbi:MAG: hypothetical protein PHQ12_06350 [Chthoniobacteraceae bacterium]|nr:hypothetical protein [Chthoniobacteraceae bacterium]
MKPRSHPAARVYRLFLLVAAALALLLPGTGRTQEPVQRSISKSGQFVVYCPDIRLRLAVMGYAETAKHDVLETLGLGDHWKFPIVIDLRKPASTDTGRPLSQVSLIQTDGGWKTEIDVELREGEFKKIRFPQLVIRAILLELAYRDHPPEIGVVYPQPPSWLIEGLAQTMQTRATGIQPDAALFRQLIETGRLPKIADFLKSNVDAMDPTSLAVHDACAASLLDLLAGTPGGKSGLARLIKGLPDSNGNDMELLLKYFPALGGNETALEKWWTLGLAHTSAADSHLALSVPETDARLTPLLKLTLVTDPKTKATTDYAITDYKAYLKNPDAKPALMESFKGLAVLLSQAHPLMRPVVWEYQRIAGELARGKTRGMDKALEAIAGYRQLIVARMDKIDDYLNWYEATQMPEQSGAFNDFLEGAKAAETRTPPKRNDSISKYIDQLEREFE